MPMPECPNYGMNYGMNNNGMNYGQYGVKQQSYYGMNYDMPEDYCVPLNPSTGAFVPKALFIDQPYIGHLPYAEGLAKGTIFPNIILPQIR